jgi:hypothetical protein
MPRLSTVQVEIALARSVGGPNETRMRRWFVLLLLLLSVGSAVARPHSSLIDAALVSLDPGDPANRLIGRLRYVQGWVLTSQDSRFGGLSSLAVRGNHFVALSDTGWLFSFDRHGARFTGLTGVPLRDRAGAMAINKTDRDTESMALSTDGTQIWIGLERRNAIWRYGDPAAAAEAVVAPAEMKKWPGNRGPESLVRLRDGRFLVISENGEGPGGAKDALLYDRDPTDPDAMPVRFGYRAPAGFDATDAAELPDGRLLVLNRRFAPLDGFAAAVTMIDPRAIAPGAVLVGEEVARLAPPLSLDNMEGLAVTEEAGQVIVWLVSDDNFSPLERTLLMKFALLPGERR